MNTNSSLFLTKCHTSRNASICIDNDTRRRSRAVAMWIRHQSTSLAAGVCHAHGIRSNEARWRRRTVGRCSVVEHSCVWKRCNVNMFIIILCFKLIVWKHPSLSCISPAMNTTSFCRHKTCSSTYRGMEEVARVVVAWRTNSSSLAHIPSTLATSKATPTSCLSNRWKYTSLLLLCVDMCSNVCPN